MKNYNFVRILAVLFIFCSLKSVMYAQVIKNTLDADGNRLIVCESDNVKSFTDKIGTYVNLSYFNNMYVLQFSFNALNPISVKEGGRVLIKTNNGQVLNFNIANSDEDKIGSLEFIGSMPISTYRISPYIVLTKDDIIKISSGVSRLRMEMSNSELTEGYFDKVFKSDKIGEKVLKDYRAISKALKETKSFEDGF